MNVNDVIDLLCEGITLVGDANIYDADTINEIETFNSFEDEGVLTNDVGIVIKTKADQKFYVTVQEY